MDQYLAHHGILGQKWGVRRFQNPDGSYTKEGIERYGKKNFKKGNVDRYQVIPKGTKFYRITTNDNETGSSSTYMSTNKKDAAFYTAYITGNNPGKNSYKVTYKNNVDLKIPSQRVLKETEEKLLKNKKYRKEVDDGLKEFIFEGGAAGKKINEVKKDFNKVAKIVNKKEKDIVDKGLTDDEFNKVVSAVNSGKLTTSEYNNALLYNKGQQRIKGFMEGPLSKATDFDKASLSLVKTPEFRKAIQTELEKQGYNAMMDESGLGRIPRYNERLQSYQKGVYNREGFNTMIVFNPDSTFTRAKTQKITRNDYINAERYYQQRRNRAQYDSRTAAHSEIKEGIMLQITTTNGDTLIHADQQPNAIIGQSVDGSQYLVHAGEWGKHKYIRKEGNRYIYPEDLQRSPGNRPQGRKRNVIDGKMDVKINDKRTTLRQINKDKEFVEYSPNKVNGLRNQAQAISNAHQNSTARDKEYEDLGGYMYRDGEQHRNNGDLQSASIKKQIAKTAERKQKKHEAYEKAAKQLTNAHQTSTKKYGDDGYLYQDTSLSDKGLQTENLKKQKTKTAARKIEKEENEKKRAKADQQRKSAHAGYEEDKKNFPDGGSTEELEIQKRKTRNRKIDKKSKEILSKGFKGNRK